MKNKSIVLGIGSIPGILLMLVFVLELAVPAGAAPGPGQVPFKINRDGSVKLGDLMKLTRRPVTRDSISDDELAAIKQRHTIKYGRGFKPTAEPEMPARGDLYQNSTILSDGTVHTILPKYALLNVPEGNKGKVVEKRVGRLVLFSHFLRRNPGWLRAEEVSLEEAKGVREFKPEKIESLAEDPKVVVSVMNGSPIGVLSEISRRAVGEPIPEVETPSNQSKKEK